jgi:hypothetical protein
MAVDEQLLAYQDKQLESSIRNDGRLHHVCRVRYLIGNSDSQLLRLSKRIVELRGRELAEIDEKVIARYGINPPLHIGKILTEYQAAYLRNVWFSNGFYISFQLCILPVAAAAVKEDGKHSPTGREPSKILEKV